MSVYKGIVGVSADLAKTGISKDRKNEQQHYRFRGIDDVYNALAPSLVKNELVILPRILSRACVERTTAKGGVLFYVTVEAEFDFVSAVDGSKHTVRTFGEAMDSADKATNKAMSAAYKYAAFQTFCIPTEGDNDADSQTHVVVPQAPAGFEEWMVDMEATAASGVDALQDAWKKSRVDYRKHLMETDPAKWEAIKASAAKKGAAA
jgi:hypothetical protein